MTARSYQLSKPAPDDGPAETIASLRKVTVGYEISWRSPRDRRRTWITTRTAHLAETAFLECVPDGKVAKGKGVS